MGGWEGMKPGTGNLGERNFLPFDLFYRDCSKEVAARYFPPLFEITIILEFVEIVEETWINPGDGAPGADFL